MLKGALLVAGVLLLAYSAEPLFHFVTNRQQITLTCEAFAASRPRALWLRVTGCEMDYLGAGVREQNGRIVELYFPARPVGWARTFPAPLVAATCDPDVLALAEDTMGGGRTPDQEQFLVMMLKIVTALRAAREIEGYGQSSVVERAQTQAALSALSTPLAANAPVIELHGRPSLLGPGAAAAAGVVLLGMVVVLRSKRRHAARAALAGARAHTLPAAPGGRLRVMLLNLPRDAGRDAIEHAPLLGTRADVIAALNGVIAGLDFDAAGGAVLEDADMRLAIDIGPDDPVHTAVVHARGAALAVLREIQDRTGWRAFDAKAGAFIAFDDEERGKLRPLDHTAA